MRKLQLAILALGVMILIMVLLKEREAIKQIDQPELSIPEQKEEPAKPAPPPKITVEQALESISQTDIKGNLEYLCSDELEGRMSGKKGNVLAAQFVKKKFEVYNLNSQFSKFPIRRINPGPKNEVGDDFTQNVYAYIEGNDPKLKDEVVVVGAHMDHLGYGPQMSRSGGGRIHPGADDNASGTVALIEIAKAFSVLKGQNKRSVAFMAFSAEEMGLLGSIHYVNNPVYPLGGPDIKKHVFMLNMDMVGYLGKGRTVTFDNAESSIDVGSVIKKLSTKYDFAKSITLRGSGGSDHAPFYNKKIPVAFLHTGSHPYYHTPQDTPNRINFEGVTKVARYGFELAWEVCNSDNKPEFNYGAFQEMDYNHDHGIKDMPFPAETDK